MVSASTYMIVFRFPHIVAGAFYFGAASRSVVRSRSPKDLHPGSVTRFQHLQAEIKRHAIIDMILLLIAIGAMSTARYW
jgi:hypothetical protein